MPLENLPEILFLSSYLKLFPIRAHFILCLCLLMLFVGCAVSAAYDEVEPIPEEKLEELGNQETAATDAYEREGKSRRSLTSTMIDPKQG